MLLLSSRAAQTARDLTIEASITQFFERERFVMCEVLRSAQDDNVVQAAALKQLPIRRSVGLIWKLL